MENVKMHFFGMLKKSGIRTQLYTIYVLTIILPLLVIGSFLLWNTNRLLTNYHRDLLESDNSRVRSILFELTTQVYNISEDIAFDSGVQEVLAGNYGQKQEMERKVDVLTLVENYEYNYAEIESIEIYTDNPTLTDYKQFYYAGEEIRTKEWYQRAVSQSSVFWVPMMHSDNYGNEYWNLCLIRKIPVMHSEHGAVLAIRISDNYLHARINSQEYETTVSVDREPVFFSTDRTRYGLEQTVPISYGESYYRYAGDRKIDGNPCLVNVSTLPMYQSDSNVYICTINEQAYGNIRNIIGICIVIIGISVVIPGILIHFFTVYFTSRVQTLRHAMHQASNEDYEFASSVSGQDELSEAFSDLETMVRNIKRKDAEMYEARIKEQELISEQQEMKFKMLASQINPHFLYNTLETIRMKAFKAGDREAATSIKLLGKSLRYVLDNTGTVFTTLDKELEHVETYLAIQKLRFGDKFDSTLEVEENVKIEELYVLPLILQPIVENALLHGLEEMESGGEIRIRIFAGEDFLSMEVWDNGCGMEREQLERLRRDMGRKDMNRSKNIGLYNINQRLSLYYGNGSLSIDSEQGKGTAVRMALPLEKMKNVR